MEYSTLTTDQQAEMLRGRILQAEADHFIHTTDADEKRALLGVVPPGKAHDADRTAIQQTISDLGNLAKAAEERWNIAKAKLDEMGEPVVKPEPQSDADRVDALAARVEQLTEALVAAQIEVPADTAAVVDDETVG